MDIKEDKTITQEVDRGGSQRMIGQEKNKKTMKKQV